MKRIIYHILFPINAFTWMGVFIFYVAYSESSRAMIVLTPLALLGAGVGLHASLNYWDRFLKWVLRVSPDDYNLESGK